MMRYVMTHSVGCIWIVHPFDKASRLGCSWMMSLYMRSFSGSAVSFLIMERVLCVVISAFDGRGGCSGRHGNYALYWPSSNVIDES